MSINKMFLLGIVFCLAACNNSLFVSHTGNMPSEDKVKMVFKGQSKNDVYELLGSPSNVVSLDQDTWIYMSSDIRQIAFTAPKEINRDVLVIKFNKEGKVSNIEKMGQEQGQNLKIEKEQTPNQEQKEGFFRKYFGGVGQYLPLGKGTPGMEP